MMAPEHRRLQSKAGYIDARPHIRHIGKILLQRTAGPYIGSQPAVGGMSLASPLHIQEPTSIAATFAAGQCQKPTYAVQHDVAIQSPRRRGRAVLPEFRCQ